MKRIIIPAAALFVFLLVSGFVFSDQAAEAVRQLNTFNGIGISISADVFYTLGNAHEIRIEGNDKDLNDLITRVKDGFLQVKCWQRNSRYQNVRKRESLGSREPTCKQHLFWFR